MVYAKDEITPTKIPDVFPIDVIKSIVVKKKVFCSLERVSRAL